MTGRLIASVLVLFGTVCAQVQSGSSGVVPSRMEETAPVQWARSATSVSVSELGMPSNAAMEFEKAERLIAKRDWEKATERLHKGLAIYPSYAAGYNNLVAVYSNLGNDKEARAVLEKAIALDDHLAPAYVNLGRLSFLESDFPHAESLLSKALSLAPAANADELFLLAYAQLTDQHLNEAIETSRQAHAARMSEHALLHLVAANACEKQNRIADSISELELYLSEEPTGSRAEKARKALAALQAQAAVR